MTAPGTQFADSSADCFLVGAIVAAASGLNFWDYVLTPTTEPPVRARLGRPH